ncbi:MAG: DUF3857 domain-containing protein [Ferruginibacter sp.]
MKRPALTLACALLSFVLSAQDFKKLPAFGDVTKEELQLTECSFDKGAAAMVIFNEGESFFQLNQTSEVNPFFRQTDFRIRIKIFNQKGFDQANIKIRYPSYDKTISIVKFSAQTYNLDASGNIVSTKVDKASVFDKKINNNYSEKSFAFPDVKAGSVIEYKYTLDNASEGIWYFQKPIPVQYSRFIVNFPPELVVAVTPVCSMPFERASSDRKGSGNYSWYTMQNIPGLADEPFMSCREDYLQKLQMQITALDFPGIPRRNLLSSWPMVIRRMVEHEYFGRQLKREIPRTADLDAMLKQLTDPYQKMTTIHNYVRNNMEWDHYYGIWALDGVKSAWKDKKGTSGEINLILINLLKDAGLNVNPILVSTKSNGLVNIAIADEDQFDKVLAHVTIGDKYYVLDATEKTTPSNLIPLEVMLSEGLLIAKPESYEWGWKTLWDDSHAYKRTVSLNAEADTNGNLKGAAKLVANDYERCRLLPEGKKSIGSISNSFKDLKGITIDSISTENAEVDSLPLTENIYFQSKGNSSGGYKYFSVNLFTGLEKNPFLAEDRATDIFYSANQDYEINGLVFIPEGYTMEELPKSLRMIMPDTSISFLRQSVYNAGILNIRYKLQFRKPFFAKSEYPEFREFYKKLFDLLNEQYVFRKEK